MGSRKKRACNKSSPILKLEDDVKFEILIRMSLINAFKQSVGTGRLLHSVDVAVDNALKSFDSLKAVVFTPFPTPLSLELSLT
ncbi:hypothetical protein C5167_005665 [Papaver somniferum]|uniref:Uncharacterized protein n=1 Tax=Papaver somniferum TaxID=3469 RepID=A0A4Y7JC21_PAPSO|nr:hypothetical protein C5167_005665 [Papaver somniferum]